MVKLQLFTTSLILGAALAASPGTSEPLYKNPSNTPRQRADDLLKLMTWEEKIGQLGGARRLLERVNGKPVFNQTALATTLKTQNGQIGYGSQFNYAWEALPVANQVRTAQINNTCLRIPFITVTDSVNGIWLSGGTLFPGTCALGATWNIPLYQEAVAAIRDENLAFGVKWVLSPEVDLARDPRNGRNGEMYGEDSYLVGEFATHYINTMQEKDENGFVKIATTIKHFVYGQSSGGVNTASMYGGLNYILNELAAPYIRAFRDANPLSIMISYATVDQIPMSANKYMVQKILRGIMDFKGLVMSDAFAIAHLYTQSKVAKSAADAGLRALRAGLQHELNPGGIPIFPTLSDSVGDPEVADMIDEAVKAILEIKFTTGTFDLPMPSLSGLNETLRSDRHLDINRNVSREAIVLLQNDGTLPLTVGSLSRVAVLGPYADVINSGTYSANNASQHTYGDTIRRSLENRLGPAKVRYIAGVDAVSTSTDASGIPGAVAAAKEAGLAVVVVGSGWGSYDPVLSVSVNRTDGEGFSHPDLSFPGMQQQLLDVVLDAGVPTILVLSGGQNFVLNDSTKRSRAILHTLLQGEFTGDALVEILLGDVNPSGKLTTTIPEAQGAFPVAYDYFPSDSQGGFTDTPRIDWFWPQLTRYAPMRFGFGLSYTTFEFSNHTEAKHGSGGNTNVTVTVVVTNTGQMSGKEVVQLYYRPAVTEIEFPVMKLIRFTKIELAPGESKEVSLTVPMHELGYFVMGEWHVETGLYNFWVGSSSRTQDLLPLNVTLT
ncbi:beta-glucosidase [Xylaria castorea]|nr:beta-glucosidase [Xylaria castorea]